MKPYTWNGCQPLLLLGPSELNVLFERTASIPGFPQNTSAQDISQLIHFEVFGRLIAVVVNCDPHGYAGAYRPQRLWPTSAAPMAYLIYVRDNTNAAGI